MRNSKSLAPLAALALPLAASAHVGVGGGMHHGFTTGFLHPLTGADHLAAMVAVGFWSALAGAAVVGLGAMLLAQAI
jgi:urease accessory protein